MAPVVAAAPAGDAADAGSGAGSSVDASLEATGSSHDAGAVPARSCRSGSHPTASGACYALFETQLTWAAARAECRARGAGWDLASIRSSDDSELLLPLISSAMWAGASDQALEGTWLWADDGSMFWRAGSALGGQYANWNSGEPNGNDPSDCMRILPGAKWADFQCENALGYICGGPAD